MGAPKPPGIKGSESVDLQTLNSMLSKNKDNPDYVVKSKKSKFHGYTMSDIKAARDEILDRRKGNKQPREEIPRSDLPRSDPDWEPPQEMEGSGIDENIDPNTLVEQLHLSLASIRAGNTSLKLKKQVEFMLGFLEAAGEITQKRSPQYFEEYYISNMTTHFHFNLLLDSQLAKQNNANSKSHDFTVNFDPPIALDPEKSYRAALNELVNMSYSWYNIAKRYNNNEFKWRKKTEEWKTVTIPDGMYDYKGLNTTIQSLIGRVDPKDEKSKFIFQLYFHTTIYRAVILLQDGYEVDLSGGEFAPLLGFDKKTIDGANNRSDRVPNITRGVDWIYIHCDLITRAVDNIGGDVMFSFSTAELSVSYPFSKEPRRLLWHPVNKNRINTINIKITDGRNNIIDLNDQDVALSIIIEEENIRK